MSTDDREPKKLNTTYFSVSKRSQGFQCKLACPVPTPSPCFSFEVRACVNDVPKIKIGKNQNQNWTLIGRGLKPPDYASLFFGNRCQTKEVARDLMFIFRKINIGGVHLIEGFPNATRQTPEHSRVTTTARRQTEPPHNTHNFCWHGPRQRSHGEGNR